MKNITQRLLNGANNNKRGNIEDKNEWKEKVGNK